MIDKNRRMSYSYQMETEDLVTVNLENAKLKHEMAGEIFDAIDGEGRLTDEERYEKAMDIASTLLGIVKDNRR
jgi:hypothetical protein